MGLMDPNGPFPWFLKYSQKIPNLYFCERFELQPFENTQKINKPESAQAAEDLPYRLSPGGDSPTLQQRTRRYFRRKVEGEKNLVS
jgi:hypothetical protein